MKRIVFALSLIILFTVVFLFSFREATAQGTFKCYMTAPSQGSNCRLQENNCEPNYEPASCSIWNNNRFLCSNRSHPCITNDLANQCANKIGFIPGFIQCPNGYPIDCGGVGFICCKDQGSCNQQPVSWDYGCNYQNGYGIKTALGCIPADNFTEFIKWLVGTMVFVASGIAFLLMAFGAIQITTSAGNPEKTKAGSELITSALSGLIFIILSLFILRLIGVEILHLPGFGT